MLSRVLKSDTNVTSDKQQSDLVLLYRDTVPSVADATFSVLREQGLNPVLVELFSGHEIAPGSSIISFVDYTGSVFTCRDESYFEAAREAISRAATMVWFAADLMVPGESSIMKGFLRSVAAENLQSRYAFVELDVNSYTRQNRVPQLLVQKLQELETAASSDSVDRECVIGGDSFCVERLLPDPVLNDEFSLRNVEEDVVQADFGSQGPIQARYRQPGVLSSLYFSQDPDFETPLGDKWVEIKTEAIGPNMKVRTSTNSFSLFHQLTHDFRIWPSPPPDSISTSSAPRVPELLLVLAQP